MDRPFYERHQDLMVGSILPLQRMMHLYKRPPPPVYHVFTAAEAKSMNKEEMDGTRSKSAKTSRQNDWWLLIIFHYSSRGCLQHSINACVHTLALSSGEGAMTEMLGEQRGKSAGHNA